jgi:hypothetical protein
MSHYCLQDKHKKVGARIRTWTSDNAVLIKLIEDHPLTQDIKPMHPDLPRRPIVVKVESWDKKRDTIVVRAIYMLNNEGSKETSVYIEVPYDGELVCEGN